MPSRIIFDVVSLGIQESFVTGTPHVLEFHLEGGPSILARPFYMNLDIDLVRALDAEQKLVEFPFSEIQKITIGR